jgi:hypothetical protein
VFYRDEGDDYVTRVSAFTSNITTTLNFIKQQKAEGGGDFPEAVHTALDKAVNNLQWSSTARTRILFLLLDAPPHYENKVITDLQKHIKDAAAKGIKIIPLQPVVSIIRNRIFNALFCSFNQWNLCVYYKRQWSWQRTFGTYRRKV